MSGGQSGGKRGPRLAAEGAAARAHREARLSEALRANLKRRKAQARGRDEPGSCPEEGSRGPEADERPAAAPDAGPGGLPPGGRRGRP